MLIYIHIIIYTLFNVICLGSITMLYKNRDNNTWELYLRCFAGVPAGIVLSFLIAPITVSNILLFALLGVVFVVLFAQILARKAPNQGKAISNTAIPTSRIYLEMILISAVSMLGYILGSLDIPVLHISMGSTACMLIIGLLAGFLVQKKLGTAQTASPVFNSFRTLGLSLFFVGNGLTTGIQALNFDFRIVLYGAIITLVAIFSGLLLCNLLFSQQKLHTGFVVAGGMTSSPAYGAISSSANEISVNCFSFAYFGALLSLVIAIQIIGR